MININNTTEEVDKLYIAEYKKYNDRGIPDVEVGRQEMVRQKDEGETNSDFIKRAINNIKANEPSLEQFYDKELNSHYILVKKIVLTQ